MVAERLSKKQKHDDVRLHPCVDHTDVSQQSQHPTHLFPIRESVDHGALPKRREFAKLVNFGAFCSGTVPLLITQKLLVGLEKRLFL